MSATLTCSWISQSKRATRLRTKSWRERFLFRDEIDDQVSMAEQKGTTVAV